MQFYQTPKFLEWLYPGLTWRKNTDSEIFLTFDDGPDEEVTPWVLHILEKYNAKATFFVVGENYQRQPATADALLQNGHKIANHTFNHLKGWQVNDRNYLDNVWKCRNTINSGNKLFRPPYGRIKRSQIQKLREFDIIMWSHLSWDFAKGMKVDKSIKALSKAPPGSILVFHDSKKSFPNLKQILEPILINLHTRGLKFETL